MSSSVETEQEKLNLISKHFNLKLENEDYKMNLGIILKENIEYLIIQLENNNNIYEKIFSLNILKDFSEAFRSYDSINDILNFIENKGKNNEILLLKKINDLKIQFKIILSNEKEDIIIELNKKELNGKLEPKDIKNENKDIQEENKNIKDENQIKEENKNIEEETKNLENKLNESSSPPKEIENNDLIDSKIITYKQIEFIIEYLKDYDDDYHEKDNIKFKLLFRGSRDGDNTITLHNKCDDKKNILFILLTEQNKIIGGYSQIGWKTEKYLTYMLDDKSFLFSVTNNKIFHCLEGKNSVCWIGTDYGLCFYRAFIIYDKFMTDENCSFGNGLSGKFNIRHFSELNEKNKFRALEYEVYQLE